MAPRDPWSRTRRQVDWLILGGEHGNTIICGERLRFYGVKMSAVRIGDIGTNATTQQVVLHDCSANLAKRHGFTLAGPLNHIRLSCITNLHAQGLLLDASRAVVAHSGAITLINDWVEGNQGIADPDAIISTLHGLKIGGLDEDQEGDRTIVPVGLGGSLGLAARSEGGDIRRLQLGADGVLSLGDFSQLRMSVLSKPPKSPKQGDLALSDGAIGPKGWGGGGEGLYRWAGKYWVHVG